MEFATPVFKEEVVIDPAAETELSLILKECGFSLVDGKSREKAGIEITGVRMPCGNLNQWDQRLRKLIDGRSGWVAKVIEEGVVRVGDAIEVLT